MTFYHQLNLYPLRPCQTHHSGCYGYSPTLSVSAAVHTTPPVSAKQRKVSPDRVWPLTPEWAAAGPTWWRTPVVSWGGWPYWFLHCSDHTGGHLKQERMDEDSSSKHAAALHWEPPVSLQKWMLSIISHTPHMYIPRRLLKGTNSRLMNSASSLSWQPPRNLSTIPRRAVPPAFVVLWPPWRCIRP